MLVLVRLLPPEVYGQFGFVTALSGFLTLYSFREFLNHTLIVRDPSDVHYQDHFTAGVALQVGVCAAANLVALALRWIPAYADVAPVVHVMSVLFLLDLPSELRVKMLERALDWRRLRLLHAIALVACGVLSVVMALQGWGVYALLLPTLLVPIVFGYDLFGRAGWRPTFEFSRERFRPARTFGLSRISAVSFVSGAGLLEAFWLSALSFATFGVFGRAIGLGQLLCGRVAGLLAQATFPVLARIPTGSPGYRRASALYLRAVTWLVAPLAAGSAWLADPLVRLLYGENWLAVVPLLPWAVSGIAVAAVVQTGYTLLLAHGQQRGCLAADVWRLIGTTAALMALAGLGLTTYLAGMAAVHVVSLVMILYWLRSDEAVTTGGVTEALVPAVVGLLSAVAAAWLVGRFMAPAAGGLARPVVESVVLGLTYVGVIRLGFRRQLLEIVDELPVRERVSRLLLLERAA